MLTKGIGNSRISKILEYIQTRPDTSLESVCSDFYTLSALINCNENTFNRFLSNSQKAQEIETILKEKEIITITKFDSIYPKQLIYSLGNDAPAVLFAKGNVNLLNQKAVGFCGSRNVSEKGIHITEECVKQLVDNDICIVSGYARGTDMAAHSTALSHKGNTVFVLAEGILNISTKKTVKDILTKENHVFISQFLPTSIWSPANAMQRNSVIIGLSKSMILIESRNTGGTYSAGMESLKRRIPLFVVDYQYPTISSEANSYFIKEGGIPLRGKMGIPNIKNILEVINYSNKSIYDSTTFEQLLISNFN